MVLMLLFLNARGGVVYFRFSGVMLCKWSLLAECFALGVPTLFRSWGMKAYNHKLNIMSMESFSDLKLDRACDALLFRQRTLPWLFDTSRLNITWFFTAQEYLRL